MGAWTAEQLTDAMRRAFLQTREGRSTDDVVICDRLNESFVKAARSIVPGADAAQLNWKLLNFRKAAKLGGVTTDRRTLRNQEEYIPAAEIAARLMEDRHSLTLDRILCDPLLRTEFDLVAVSVAPGYSNYEYRKAALKLRKARRLRPEQVKRILAGGRQTGLQQASSISASSQVVPDFPGIYLLSDKNGYLYIGETENLRLRLRKHLDHSDNKSLAHYFWQEGIRAVQIETIAFPEGALGSSKANRKALEAELIRSRRPRFNIQLST